MKAFISWSGAKSRLVAVALRDWLPGVINSVDPFVSAKDIYAGSRWQAYIASELDAANFGIVCVTQENQGAPWLNFEAGALAKAVDLSRVVPLAIDLKPSDVQLPLGQFQAQPATKSGIHEVIKSINAGCEASLPDPLLDKAFGVWWPGLEQTLDEINKKNSGTTPSTRSDRELLEETLNTVRSLARTSGLAQVQQTSPLVPRDHPLVADLRTLLAANGYGDMRIMFSRSDRRIGVRGGADLPVPLQAAMRDASEPFAIRIDFLPPRRTGPADQQTEPESAQDEESE